MSLILAFKAFWKALKNPKQAQEFIEEASAPAVDKTEGQEMGGAHLRLLSHLQQTGRLIDFLKEDISSFTDAQIGAAVRKIHQDCSKCLEDLVTIRPVMEENEGASIRIPQGYDPNKIKVVGKVSGEPPFTGILVHKGWKAHKSHLPKQTVQFKVTDVICPAEVEVK